MELFSITSDSNILFVKGPTIKFDPEEIYMFAIVSSDIDPAPKSYQEDFLTIFFYSLKTSRAKSPRFVNSRILISFRSDFITFIDMSRPNYKKQEPLCFH